MKYLLVFLSLTLAACSSVPTNHIAAYGSSAKAATQKVEYVLGEFKDISNNNLIVQMADSNKAVDQTHFDATRDNFIAAASIKNISLYRANAALSKYTDALIALSVAGSKNELDMASVKLSASLNDFNDQAVSLGSGEIISKADSSSIGAGIAAIGGLYVEKKKSEALKNIVVKADPLVKKIADIIISELNTGVIARRLYSMKLIEFTDYVNEYNDQINTLSFSERKDILDKLYEKYISLQSSDAAVVQAIKAVSALKTAHAALTASAQTEKSNADGLVEALSVLKNTAENYNALELLLLTCESEIVADEDKGLTCK